MEFKDVILSCINNAHFFILIESKWNLKEILTSFSSTVKHINRIKVEFKDSWVAVDKTIIIHINRIKVEFKVYSASVKRFFASILIESKWNLKVFYANSLGSPSTILIESKWNLKDRKLYSINAVL